MSAHPKPEILHQIEARWREIAKGQSEASIQHLLDFELKTVDIHRKNLAPLLKGHGAGPDHRMLDFGSGPGASATAVAYELGTFVVGVEPNFGAEPMAKLWPKAYEVENKVDLRFTSDTLHLPFNDESFDFVLTSSCLEYIQGDRGPYIREMVRVLKTGGRLVVAGTSNAAWPREVHSGTWLLNWMPNLGPKIRAYRGLNPEAERGVTFGEICAAAPQLRFVRGQYDELDAFSGRLAGKFGPLFGPAKSLLRGTLGAFDRRAYSAVEWPAEAFLPWLNLGFEKLPQD